VFEIIMEAALPKLSQTSLYEQMNQTSDITGAVKSELGKMNEYRVTPDRIPEVLALMKLNGDANIKKVLKAYETGDIVVLFHKDNKRIPTALPFIIIGHEGQARVYVFADKVVTALNSQREYTNLMATMEAAYYALAMFRKPNAVIANRNVAMCLADLYTRMVIMPLEQKIYMKGDNLTKAMLYTITYFYRIIDGPEKLNASSIPYKKIISDKIPDSSLKQIVEDVRGLENNNFMGFLDLIKQINPIRYKDLDAMYLQHFSSACGVPLIFGLENPGYVFLLVTSSNYKSSLTSFNLNKACAINAKKTIKLLNNL
jgi:hypothetical protein